MSINVAVTDQEEIVLLNSVSMAGAYFDATTIDDRHSLQTELKWNCEMPTEVGLYKLSVEYEWSADEEYDYIVTDCMKITTVM